MRATSSTTNSLWTAVQWAGGAFVTDNVANVVADVCRSSTRTLLPQPLLLTQLNIVFISITFFCIDLIMTGESVFRLLRSILPPLRFMKQTSCRSGIDTEAKYFMHSYSSD
jgi:hypothetical protein